MTSTTTTCQPCQVCGHDQDEHGPEGGPLYLRGCSGNAPDQCGCTSYENDENGDEPMPTIMILPDALPTVVAHADHQHACTVDYVDEPNVRTYVRGWAGPWWALADPLPGEDPATARTVLVHADDIVSLRVDGMVLGEATVRALVAAGVA